jgi:DNA-binding Lrp family transcriptional regulator
VTAALPVRAEIRRRGGRRQAPLLLDEVDRRLLDEHQRGFPLCERPFAEVGRRLGVGEGEVIARLKRLTAAGAVSRVGAVLAPRRIGASTLAAMAVPPERLAEVAELVNAFPEVNHNYEREHRFNLWFVLTAPDRGRLDRTLEAIAAATGLAVLDLPMLEEYHIDLGFPIRWT